MIDVVTHLEDVPHGPPFRSRIVDSRRPQAQTTRSPAAVVALPAGRPLARSAVLPKIAVRAAVGLMLLLVGCGEIHMHLHLGEKHHAPATPDETPADALDPAYVDQQADALLDLITGNPLPAAESIETTPRAEMRPQP